MKKTAQLLAVICLITLLAGCSAPAAQTEQTEQIMQTDLVGTWVGDGTMDIIGLEHDVEFVDTWTFQSDGTAVAEKTLDNGTTETLTYTYRCTDDTLTFVRDEASCGIGYILEDDTLSFRTGVDTFAVFTKK